QKDWAVELAGWGYVALLVDSFEPRKAENMCASDKVNTGEWDRVVGAQVPDAVGAGAHLATLPFVDANRIAVMGWAKDAVLSTVFEGGMGQLYDAKFQAAVAFYPDCRGNMSGRFSAPALMLIGDKDDARRPDYCQRTAVASQGSSALAELKLYPGAHHGFDDPQVGERFYLEDAWNTYRNPPRGITFGYSSTAHKDALKRVNEFLAKHLK
ncbi:MAG: dienelactone hydrolase family protein, partial [Acidobacteria bacterium]|nr:dienelactone hydrolase family protein [Acidobacteriota bacterium]